RPAGADAAGRQALLRARVRASLGRAERAAAQTGPQGRARAAWDAAIPSAAAADRVRQRHLQGPTRPGTPRRPHPWRGRGPGLTAHPGPGRRDLAQPPHQPADPAVAGRLRPLTLESIIYSTRVCL